MIEWIRFILCAACVLGAIAVAGISLLGVNRFSFDLNRLHAAGMCDSLMLPLLILGCVLYAGLSATSWKLLCAALVQWLTSPVSGHLIGRLIFETDDDLKKEAASWK